MLIFVSADGVMFVSVYLSFHHFLHFLHDVISFVSLSCNLHTNIAYAIMISEGQHLEHYI